MTIFSLSKSDLQRRNSVKWARFEPDVLPMFVAEMDCNVAAPVAERLRRAIEESDTGYPELPMYQEAFADFASWLWDWHIERHQMSLAGDVMQGMRELTLVVTQPGDAVAINTPVYPPFRNTVTMTGRHLVEVPLTEDDRLDFDALNAAFQQHSVRAFLLCNPHNPNGTAHTRAELEQLARVAQDNNVVVLSDEIHAPLQGESHVPFLTVPGSERSFVVTAASKAWNLAGMKAALIIAGTEALPTLRALPPIVAESASWFGVLAHSTALREARDWLTEVSQEIRDNKQFLAGLLDTELGLTYQPSEATYLAWVDCAPLGLEHPGKAFHEIGRVRFGFGTDYASGATQHVRINCATSEEFIAEGVRRMAQTVRENPVSLNL